MDHVLFDHSIDGLDGQPIDLTTLNGKVVLVVNTASQCGFTPQFAGLQDLYRRYRERGLVVLGFPCNQFGRQDPGDATQIGAFCRRNYGVDFPMAARIEVNGRHAHPFWRALKRARPGWLGIGRIHWNFTKFLIDRDGRVVARFAPMTSPARIAAKIEALL